MDFSFIFQETNKKRIALSFNYIYSFEILDKIAIVSSIFDDESESMKFIGTECGIFERLLRFKDSQSKVNFLIPKVTYLREI